VREEHKEKDCLLTCLGNNLNRREREGETVEASNGKRIIGILEKINILKGKQIQAKIKQGGAGAFWGWG